VLAATAECWIMMALCGADTGAGKNREKAEKRERVNEGKKKGKGGPPPNASLPSVNFMGSWYECECAFRHLSTHMYQYH
jgi:hypothetical protein